MIRRRENQVNVTQPRSFTADGELHDPDSEPEDDTTEPSHDADSKSFLDEVPDDEPEDGLEPWVDHIVRATHTADDMLAANGITSDAQEILE